MGSAGLPGNNGTGPMDGGLQHPGRRDRHDPPRDGSRDRRELHPHAEAGLDGDAVSHAALPGVALAFIVATGLGWREKSLPILLVGATLSGLAGVAAILVMRRLTRLKEDTALGIVLSVFFGSGTALLGVIQQMKGGHPAGLESFIFGKNRLDGARRRPLDRHRLLSSLRPSASSSSKNFVFCALMMASLARAATRSCFLI